MRKVNAVISLLISVLLLDHALFKGAWALSKGKIPTGSPIPARLLVVLMVAHAIICIILLIRSRKGAKNGERTYAKLNGATIYQRVSGMLLILFSAFHVASAISGIKPPVAIHAVLLPLFFLLALSHVAVSGSKAFVTLGVGNAKFIKVADILIKALCAVTLVIDLVGFYTYLV